MIKLGVVAIKFTGFQLLAITRLFLIPTILFFTIEFPILLFANQLLTT